MRLTLGPFAILLCAALLQAQTGPCSEKAINDGKLPVSDDAFSYMPPYGKPVTGKPALKEANTKSFSDRTNIKSDWAGDHKIVISGSGDMAYEQGTMHMSSDSKSQPKTGHEEFNAVMLIIYKAKGDVCQQVAMTMQPLEEGAKK
jgi:hypothetical protein